DTLRAKRRHACRMAGYRIYMGISIGSEGTISLLCNRKTARYCPLYQPYYLSPFFMTNRYSMKWYCLLFLLLGAAFFVLTVYCPWLSLIIGVAAILIAARRCLETMPL